MNTKSDESKISLIDKHKKILQNTGGDLVSKNGYGIFNQNFAHYFTMLFFTNPRVKFYKRCENFLFFFAVFSFSLAFFSLFILIMSISYAIIKFFNANKIFKYYFFLLKFGCTCLILKKSK